MSLTAMIVSAFVSNNPVPVTELPNLIKAVNGTLGGLDGASVSTDAPKPAVPVKKSIQHEFIVCLEDGKHLKMLKRYLRTRFNLTPEEYRTRWGLAHDYPMVAPAYAKRRSDFAKEIGLGRTSAARAKRGARK